MYLQGYGPATQVRWLQDTAPGVPAMGVARARMAPAVHTTIYRPTGQVRRVTIHFCHHPL